MTLYAAVETALLTLVRASDEGGVFDTTNSSRGDWAVRDASGRPLSAVLYRAAKSVYGDKGKDGRGSHGKRQEQHTIGIQVARAQQTGQGGDEATYIALSEAVDSLIASINQYPRLNNMSGVRRAQVTERHGPVLNAAKTHLIETILVEVACEIELVQTESAQ